MIRLTRKGDDLEVCVNRQCVVLHEHYQYPRLFTLDPIRSLFSKRRRTLFFLQHQLHMMTGWLSMSMHAERVLLEARDMRDGSTREIDI
jgi:hypothetical protein